MQKIIYLCCLLLGLQQSIQAQLWERQLLPLLLPYEGSIDLYDVQETVDGNYVVAGKVSNIVGPAQIDAPILYKLDATTGATLWHKEYYMTGIESMRDVSLVANADGSFHLAALKGQTLLYMALDSVGDTLSTQMINYPCAMNGNCHPQTARLRATNDGNYALAVGTTMSLVGISMPINELIKIDPSGTILWQKSYGKGFFADMQPTISGGYVWCGSDNGNQTLLYELDANGDSLHLESYTNFILVGIKSFKQTPDSGWIVSGVLPGFTGFTPALAKLDAARNLEWQSIVTYGIGSTEFVSVVADGSYLVTGQENDLQGNVYYDFVSRVDAAGTIIGRHNFGRPAEGIGRVVRPTSDGNLIMAGHYSQDTGYVVKTGLLLDISKPEMATNLQVQVAPNPAQSSTTIQVEGLPLEHLSWRLVDPLGRVLKQQNIQTNSIQLERGNLPAGLYYLQFLQKGTAIKQTVVQFY